MSAARDSEGVSGETGTPGVSPRRIPRRAHAAAAAMALLVGVSLLDIERANALFGAAGKLVVGYFATLFAWLTTVSVLLVFALAFHPAARRRLGPDHARPEFSRTAWLAMLFSAGLASGILYWGTAEPITHLGGNPFLGPLGIAPGSEAAGKLALTLTIFHWGLHGWAIYVLGGLAIALAAYRMGQPLAFHSALFPLFGERIRGWPGQCIDLLALFATVFGVATSIGLAVAGMNATLGALVDIGFDITTQLAIVALVCGLGIVSAITGVSRGIRLLSLANTWVSLALLLAVALLGPTRALLADMADSAESYATHLLSMGFYVAETAPNRAWQGAWTIFYWAWWLAWMPFVALFVARISYGRTIREFIVWVMLVPTLVVIVWMSVLGGSAVERELADPGSVSGAVAVDYSQGIVAVLAPLGGAEVGRVLIAVTAVLLFSWLITSLDSATLVIGHLLGAAERYEIKLTWGVLLGALSGLLLAAGGVPALQSASIVIGLPVALLTMLILAAVLRAMLAEPGAWTRGDRAADDASP